MLVTVKDVIKELAMEDTRVDVHFIACKSEGTDTVVRVLETNRKTCNTRLVTMFRVDSNDEIYLREGKSIKFRNRSLNVMISHKHEDVLTSTLEDTEKMDCMLIPTELHRYVIEIPLEERHMYPLRQVHIDKFACWGFELALAKALQNPVNPMDDYEKFVKLTEAIHENENHVNLYWVWHSLNAEEYAIHYFKSAEYR